MPSTNEATLQLIQQEISEVIQREKELKEKYVNSQQTVAINGNGINGVEAAKSLPSAHMNGKKNGRLFTPNPTTKGVMQRFIKSKGKLANLASNSNTVVTPQTFASLDFYDGTTPTIPAGSATRNGFVPINERLKKEFVEMEKREVELQLERRKSQSDLVALYETSDLKRSFQSSRSISQMSDCDSFQESASSSLKPAKSLADLCNLDNEEIESPGSLTLIKQWENIIQKNQVRI